MKSRKRGIERKRERVRKKRVETRHGWTGEGVITNVFSLPKWWSSLIWLRQLQCLPSCVCVCVCVRAWEKTCALMCEYGSLCVSMHTGELCGLLESLKFAFPSGFSETVTYFLTQVLDVTTECFETLCCRLMPKTATRNSFIYFAFNWFRDPLKHLGHIFGAMHSENSLEQISLYGFIITHRKIIK